MTDEDDRELLDTIGASAHRGADMVAQVLTFARGVEGQRARLTALRPVLDADGGVDGAVGCEAEPDRP